MATNPTLLTMPIAENGAKNTIPATQAAAGDGLLSQSTGFPPETALPLGAGGKAPTREDFNGAFNLLSNLAFYSQKGWTFQYDATQAYYKGCIVMDATDGKRYECINDVAAGTILPSADTQNVYWREYTPGGVPLGSILPYSANAQTPPYSFLFCEGQAVSREMYPDLFDLIGTTYGAGNGSTTFNLPNMLGKYPQGDTTAGTVKSAGLPNISGSLQGGYSGSPGLGIFRSSDGVFNTPIDNSLYLGSPNTAAPHAAYTASFDASRSSAIYGNSDTVTPPTLTFRWIIKAYDAPTPSSAQIDLSQYAADLARRLTREQTPAFNKRDVITTSGTYTAPVTGWYKITVKGGGGGGSGGVSTASSARTGASGGEGGTGISYQKLTAGDTVTVTIGAGGAGGAANGGAGSSGGNTSVVVNGITITGGGGNGGGTWSGGMGGSGTIPGAAGGYSTTNATSYSLGAQPGGGGQLNINRDAINGCGGLGGVGNLNTTSNAGSAGGNGYVEFLYFDPTLM